MHLENKVSQLIELMADLIPTIDRLARFQEKTNMDMDEMRLSNMRLADVVANLQSSNGKLAQSIDKLSIKFDKISEFENRLQKLEKAVFKIIIFQLSQFYSCQKYLLQFLCLGSQLIEIQRTLLAQILR
jgi:hypothetical protein